MLSESAQRRHSHFAILSNRCRSFEWLGFPTNPNRCFLTRFNKIAIQGTPQMAVDKEALICLSRVYSYYFKCNFPLFYVYPALTRYLSILFLNILTLLACTHSSDNLFHTLMVLCENENFLTSNLLCFFTRVKLCPLVILLSLIWKKG